MKILDIATCLVAVANAYLRGYDERKGATVKRTPWETCEDDSNCLENHVCVDSMTLRGDGKDGLAWLSSVRGCVH